jgi:hypothetical protein
VVGVGDAMGWAVGGVVARAVRDAVGEGVVDGTVDGTRDGVSQIVAVTSGVAETNPIRDEGDGSLDGDATEPSKPHATLHRKMAERTTQSAIAKVLRGQARDMSEARSLPRDRDGPAGTRRSIGRDMA